MSDTTKTAMPTPKPVQITLELPGRIAKDFEMLVQAGVHSSLADAVRHATIVSWRFERGSYHSLRLDLKDEEKPADEDDQDGAAQA